MRKHISSLLWIAVLLFFSTSLLASPSVTSTPTKYKSQNLELQTKGLINESGVGTVANYEVENLKPVLTHYDFYTNCGGTLYVCGWVLLVYNDVNNTILYLETMNQCGNPDFCGFIWA